MFKKEQVYVEMNWAVKVKLEDILAANGFRGFEEKRFKGRRVNVLPVMMKEFVTVAMYMLSADGEFSWFTESDGELKIESMRSGDSESSMRRSFLAAARA